jgi:acyl carrier protein
MSDIQERITNIVVELLGVESERVTPDASFREDLEADSLDLVELIMTMEEEFDIEISDDEAEKLVTVNDVMDYVNKTV